MGRNGSLFKPMWNPPTRGGNKDYRREDMKWFDQQKRGLDYSGQQRTMSWLEETELAEKEQADKEQAAKEKQKAAVDALFH
jgi:hypothetical protein